MKKISFLILILALFGCAKQLTVQNNKQHVFILEDKDDSKFYLIESVKKAYSEETFKNSPIVAIDGVVFIYKKNLDTIVLPLKRKEITNLQLLHKNSSSIIYGEKEINGAIIINTIHLK